MSMMHVPGQRCMLCISMMQSPLTQVVSLVHECYSTQVCSRIVSGSMATHINVGSCWNAAWTFDTSLQ